jgi:hypothetical protein
VAKAVFSFDGHFDIEDAAAMEALVQIKTRSARVQAALEEKINELDERLVERIQTQKLLGQVLKYRTGTLYRSINVIPAASTASGVTGGVEGAGGPAFYGKAHEDGVDHSWTIEAFDKKALRFIGRGGKEYIRRMVTHPPLPQRSFMQSAAAEMEPEFVSEIEAVCVSVLRAQPRDARGRFTSYSN